MLKKIRILLVILFSITILTGCDLLKLTNKKEVRVVSISVEDNLNLNVPIDEFELTDIKVTITKEDGSKAFVSLNATMIPSEQLSQLTFVGTHNITVNYEGFTTSFNLTLLDEDAISDKERYRVDVSESISDAVEAIYDYYNDDNIFYYLPSKGEVKMLVVPIQFPNDKFTNSELSRISYGFFGDGREFETVKSYYLKSSYGALELNGTILKPYTAKYNYSYYENYTSRNNEYATGIDLLIEELIDYYEINEPGLDLSQFDSEGDRFIDAVHLVYSAPVNYEDDSIYWAMQNYYNATSGQDMEDYVSWGDYEFDSYVFSGVDFFYENRLDNAWTQIHETGHLLGLEDYYDYTENMDSNRGGLGGADMMDYTSGDHNPFSKLLLDWINPIVIDRSTKITINKFESSGDAIIIADNFDSIFGEYFILEFYTPTGLNAENGYLSEAGLLMYHVDASLPTDYDNLDEYSYYFKNNNSDSSTKLIKIEEADGDNNISKYGKFAQNSDLLKEHESYTLKLYNNEVLCEVIIEEITEETLTLSINLK